MIRVVLHAHSTWSYDGRWRLNSIARLFGTLGFDAVMMTEHDTGFDPRQFESYRAACREASTSSCSLIPGIEYSSPDNAVHILTWGLDRFLGEHRPIEETLTHVTMQGGAAILAHPVRRQAFRQFEAGWTPHLHGIELWNRKSDGLTFGREAAELVCRTGLPATVGMDFHQLRNLWPISHRFESVTADTDMEAQLVKALRNREHSPEAFGKTFLDANGVPVPSMNDGLERARRHTAKVFRFFSR